MPSEICKGSTMIEQVICFISFADLLYWMSDHLQAQERERRVACSSTPPPPAWWWLRSAAWRTPCAAQPCVTQPCDHLVALLHHHGVLLIFSHYTTLYFIHIIHAYSYYMLTSYKPASLEITATYSIPLFLECIGVPRTNWTTISPALYLLRTTIENSILLLFLGVFITQQRITSCFEHNVSKSPLTWFTWTKCIVLW